MKTNELTYKEALHQAVSEEMERDESVLFLGEHVANDGGAGGVTLGIKEKFGDDRIFDVSLSAEGLLNLAFGMASSGKKPIIEFPDTDQAMAAFGKLATTVASASYLSGGQMKLPMVILVPVGLDGNMSAYANNAESFFASVPGIKVLAPANPAQAKGLLKAAVLDDGPVVLFENMELMNMKGPVPESEDYVLQLGKGFVERDGKDLTLVCWGAALPDCMEVADEFSNENIDIAVINPLTLSPLDMQPIIESLKETGHLLIVHHDKRTGGIGAEIASRIMESNTLEYLEAPILRVCGLDVPMPKSAALQEVVIPQREDIKQAVYDVLEIL